MPDTSPIIPAEKTAGTIGRVLSHAIRSFPGTWLYSRNAWGPYAIHPRNKPTRRTRPDLDFSAALKTINAMLRALSPADIAEWRRVARHLNLRARDRFTQANLRRYVRGLPFTTTPE